MMKILSVLLWASIALILSSCSYLNLTGDDGVFRDRKGDYLDAPVEPDMRVPDELDSYTLDQLYVVPEEVVASRLGFADEVPKPKPLESNRPEGVVIRRYSGENWIVIAASLGQVWPRIRDFWTQTGITLEYENPVEGVMETSWQPSSENPQNRDKFRVRIEPGLHSGSSEVFVVQISRPRDTIGTELVIWPEVSESEDREFDIMQQISQYLADRTDIYSSSSSSLLAGSLAGERKANLVEGGASGSVLNLAISPTRAWGQIAQALDRAEVLIVDRNREQLYFNVEFAGLESEQDSPGFLTRVFTSRDEEAAPSQAYRINLLETQSGIQVMAEAIDESTADSQLETELLQLILNNIG